jgi:hypothetical protein
MTPGFGRHVHNFEHKIYQVPGKLILEDTVRVVPTYYAWFLRSSL